MTNADVIVVGGGPAGSMSAMLLARAGFDVVLLERRVFPRAKPCGDCLSPGANAVLQRLGVWEDVLRAAPAFLRGWQLTSPGGATFGAAFDEISDDATATRALAIRRDIFDALLLTHARAAGVRVMHHAHVHELTRERTGGVTGVRARVGGETMRLGARLVVGADGLRSIVARRLNAFARKPRVRKTSFTWHTHVPGARDFGEMRLQRDACLGIAPIEDRPGGLHNVTLVLHKNSLDSKSDVRRLLAYWMPRFAVDVRVDDDAPLASGPFDWPVRRVTFDGAALVGDAAGYYDPFTGQGIYHALAGAELLAEHAHTALRTGNVTRTSLSGYDAAHWKLRRATNRLQRIIDFVCARPALADFAFARCARNHTAARELLGATGDLLPADSLFSARFLMRLLA